MLPLHASVIYRGSIYTKPTIDLLDKQNQPLIFKGYAMFIKFSYTYRTVFI